MDALKGIGKQRFLDALRAEGCRVNHSRYSMLHQNPIFQDAKVWASGGLFPAFVGQKAPLYGVDDFPVTAAARESLIWMPTFPHAGTALVDQYIKAFKKVDANLDELRN
jgi:dTDP-4-amino-4,6-dideoxygalactose transaminase